MESLKDRFESRLEALGFTKASVAQQLGMSPQGVSNWVARDTIPSDWLFALSDLLLCNPRWLATGEGLPSPSPGVPLLRSSDVVPWVDGKLVVASPMAPVVPVVGQERTRLGARGFGWRVEDDGASPEIMRGDLVLVAPGGRVRPGSLVLAETQAGDGLVVRRMRDRSGEAEGRWELVPAHPDYSVVVSDGPLKPRILAPLSELRRRYTVE